MMTAGTRSRKGNADARVRRVILVVDASGEGGALKAAWAQLRLSDVLKFVADPENAVRLLPDGGEPHATPVAAVVLDPETTGEGTWDFLDRVQNASTSHPVPIVLWSRDHATYRTLKSSGVVSVVPKQMVLRVIQALDEACRLSHRWFRPFAGAQ